MSNRVPDKTKVSKEPTQNKLWVKVYSPFKVYFDDYAESISAENATGPFDVLPRHYNFISLLIPCNIEINYEKNNMKISINTAVMHVRNNRVTVFLDV